MRERRQFLDRGAAALWPAYRRPLREYERVVLQRNAAPGARRPRPRGLGRAPGRAGRRAAPAPRPATCERLRPALREARIRPQGEPTTSRLAPEAAAAERGGRARRLRAELRRAPPRRAARARAAWWGPTGTRSRLDVDGEDAAEAPPRARRAACCWRWRWRRSRCTARSAASPAVALLDDLDSELDEERARRSCAARWPGGGQALVTTAHPGWAPTAGRWGARVRRWTTGG